MAWPSVARSNPKSALRRDLGAAAGIRAQAAAVEAHGQKQAKACTQSRPEDRAHAPAAGEDLPMIRAGTYDYVAAEASGISRTTFFDWVRRGEGRSDRATVRLEPPFTRTETAFAVALAC
jgi:hypothetical protein